MDLKILKIKIHRLGTSVKYLGKRLLEKNILVFIISSIVFYLLFLSPQGIFVTYYKYTVTKKEMNQEVIFYEKKIESLEKKMKYLQLRNPDVIEEIKYYYENKDMYPQNKKSIITIKT